MEGGGEARQCLGGVKVVVDTVVCSLLSPVLPGCVQFLSVVQDHPPPPASPQHVLISSDIAINLPPSGA